MLQFKSDHTFTIAQFTDTHYRNGEAPDLETLRVMNHVLDMEKPDLVVLSGDVIDGSHCRDPIKSWADAARPMIDRNLPWGAVFGNHDDEGSANRSQLMAAMQQLPGCLSIPGPANVSGVGNFVLPVFEDDQPAANLYFLDSNGYADRIPKQYDWIKQDQIDWYLRADHRLPALMFFHIPLPEYDTVWDFGKCTGSKFEPVCSPIFNSGLFNALKSAGDVMGTFVGHDHTNDYVGEMDGIRLCYGRATGFASYGREGFPRGARMIRLIAGKRDFVTWVSLDSRV
jgi:Calcineurin-like phosphoesterase